MPSKYFRFVRFPVPRCRNGEIVQFEQRCYVQLGWIKLVNKRDRGAMFEIVKVLTRMTRNVFDVIETWQFSLCLIKSVLYV